VENDAMSLNVLVVVIMCLYVMWYAPWLCDQLESFMWYAPWLGELRENIEVHECFSILTPLCCDDIHDVTPRVSALAGCDNHHHYKAPPLPSAIPTTAASRTHGKFQNLRFDYHEKRSLIISVSKDIMAKPIRLVVKAVLGSDRGGEAWWWR
ncbi:hypothetical protein Tco_1283240, partial [Tanacetum coccineum]